MGPRCAVRGLILAALAVVGCGITRVSLPSGVSTGDSPAALVGPFSVAGRSSDGCVWLEMNGSQFGALWPQGYSATFDPVRVYDQAGQLVATEGEQLWAGGGFASGHTAPCEGSGVVQLGSIQTHP